MTDVARDNADPHPDLTAAMHDGWKRAWLEVHYKSPRFQEMLRDLYGFDTAIQLIRSPRPTTGFTHLWEHHRLDLTVEALVLSPRWSGLFERNDLLDARKRLADYDYKFPEDSWDPDARETPVAVDLQDAPTERVRATAYRILRDTALARRIKRMHGFRCQICDERIELLDGSFYAEAHHIQPLGSPHNGPDIEGNVLCLCPTHHVMLDYCIIPLSHQSLKTVKGHLIESRFIEYHNALHRKGQQKSR